MIELPVAVRFQVLPDVVDLSYVLTLNGFGGFVTALIGQDFGSRATGWPGWYCSATSSVDWPAHCWSCSTHSK